jgi:drug/metabolite transporter (DMT)-like permease
MTDQANVSRSSAPLLGIGLMICAMTVLPLLDVVAKHLGREGLPVLQIVWARLFFGTFVTLPFAAKLAGPKGLLPNMPVVHAVRAVFLIAATSFFFWALSYQSIAETLSMFFVQPLIVTMMSPWVLGETVGLKRWRAVAVGFCGTLVIIRPGFQELGPGIVLALLAGFSLAIYMLLTRRIAGSASPMVTTYYTSLLGAVIMTAVAYFVWVPPTLEQWGFFVLLALIANGGHYLIVKAYDYGEASLLAPLAYTEMVMATVAGWYFFGDFPDRWTFIGVAILIASAIYISLVERKRRAPDDVREFEQP